MFLQRRTILKHLKKANKTGCCDCPVDDTYYDGANCFVLEIAETSIPFIEYGKGYLYPVGNDDYPYGLIYGYEIEDFLFA